MSTYRFVVFGTQIELSPAVSVLGVAIRVILCRPRENGQTGGSGAVLQGAIHQTSRPEETIEEVEVNGLQRITCIGKGGTRVDAQHGLESVMEDLKF